MHEPVRLQVRVEQGRDDADLGQAEPHDHELGPVLHEQRHRLTRLQAPLQPPLGHAVGRLVRLLEAQHAPAELHAGLVRPPSHALLEQVRQQRVVARVALGLQQRHGLHARVQQVRRDQQLLVHVVAERRRARHGQELGRYAERQRGQRLGHEGHAAHSVGDAGPGVGHGRERVLGQQIRHHVRSLGGD